MIKRKPNFIKLTYDGIRSFFGIQMLTTGSLIFDFLQSRPDANKIVRNARKYTDGLFGHDVNTITHAYRVLRENNGMSSARKSEYVLIGAALPLQSELFYYYLVGKLPRPVLVQITAFWLNVRISDIELSTWTKTQRALLNVILKKYNMIDGEQFTWKHVRPRTKKGYISLQTRELRYIHNKKPREYIFV